MTVLESEVTDFERNMTGLENKVTDVQRNMTVSEANTTVLKANMTVLKANMTVLEVKMTLLKAFTRPVFRIFSARKALKRIYLCQNATKTPPAASFPRSAWECRQ